MSRSTLNTDTVIDAAAELADSGGLGAVTLASLAKRLNVKPPSLYNHVDGLEGIRRELALRGLREIASRIGKAAVGRARDDALFAIVASYREFARQHPGLYAASLRAPSPDDVKHEQAAADVIAIVEAVLSGYGLKGHDSIHAVRGLRAVIHGFVSLEAAGAFGLSLGLDESADRLLRAFVAGIRRGLND